MIEPLTDLETIKSIWRGYNKELGPCSNLYIQNRIDKNQFFCYTINNQIAGIVDYEIHDRLREVEVGILVVLPEYRGQGISTKLIYHTYKEAESLIKTLGYKFVVKAYQGLPNNKMYESLCTEFYPYGNGEHPYYKYIFDIEHIERSATNDRTNN